jgi:ABC-type bacteriocin/lantibiotic exporter with double-glycine peptidase domain
MVTQYHGKVIGYDDLLILLDIRAWGAPSFHINRLAQIGCRTELLEGSPETVCKAIDDGIPVIAFVRTGELSWWKEDTGHAVVLIGYDNSCFWLNDPVFPGEPIRVPVDEFMLAWIEFDYDCALVSPPE